MRCGALQGFSTRAESSLVSSPRQHMPRSTVLLLGEGNFTFSAALSLAQPQLRLVATSLESESESCELWNARAAIALLRERGHTVLHGVDATALGASELRGEQFNVAALLFPHSGAKGRVERNRSLLAAVCASVARDVDCATLEIALASGQGGTAADGQARRAWGDSWQLPFAAAEGGLLITAAVPFEEAEWQELGYRPSGCWRGMGRGTLDHVFRTHEALVHSLRRAGDGVITPFPVHFSFNSSYWVLDGQLAQSVSSGHHAPLLDSLLEAGRGITSGALRSVHMVDVWSRPEDGQLSVCVRMEYVDAARPLTARGAAALHEHTRASLPAALPAARLTLRTNPGPRTTSAGLL